MSRYMDKALNGFKNLYAEGKQRYSRPAVACGSGEWSVAELLPFHDIKK